MADTRSFTGGRYVLDVDGFNVAYLKKFSGLAMEADIVTHDIPGVTGGLMQKKNVANIKWTPGKATVGIGMGKGMYDWIKSSFDMNFLTKNGSFTAADFNYKATSRLDFMNGLITSVTVPKLDGSSKDAAYFDVEFEAEQVRWSKGGGEDIRAKLGPKQKAWLCSNFRVEIGSLPCNRVATVDSFTWKQSVTPDQIGIFREYTKHPAKVTVPDIKLSISYADHQPWADAAKKWFVDGHHLESDEMTGRIVFLDPNMSTELGEISLQNVGFKKFSDEDNEANSDKIKRFTAELYVEKMTFQISVYDA
ncbi:MAG TPA: phage tail protein [Kofleriaceae bacterium]|nr:phage tail protein [Kofleriaceae bacterium]